MAASWLRKSGHANVIPEIASLDLESGDGWLARGFRLMQATHKTNPFTLLSA